MNRINEIKTKLDVVAVEDILHNRSIKVRDQIETAKQEYAAKYGKDYKFIESYAVEDGVVVLSLWERPSNRHSKIKGFTDNACVRPFQD